MYRKIRNTFRFMLANTADFDNSVELSAITEVNQYLLYKLNILNEAIKVHLANFNFRKIVELITLYMTNELNSFYLDFAKDVLYINEISDIKRRHIQYVLSEHIEYFAKVLNPILPHTMYEVYDLFKDKNIMLEDIPETIGYAQTDFANAPVVLKFDKVLAFRSRVSAALEVARTDKLIGKSFEAKLEIQVPTELFTILSSIPKNDLELYLIVSSISISEAADELIIVSKFSETNCERC